MSGLMHTKKDNPGVMPNDGGTYARTKEGTVVTVTITT